MLGKIILFSGGKYDIAFIKQYLADKSFDTVACADSGLEAAHAVGVNVDYIMGDFDSVSQETLAEYRSADKAAKFVQYPKAKDYTDTADGIGMDIVGRGIWKSLFWVLPGDDWIIFYPI